MRRRTPNLWYWFGILVFRIGSDSLSNLNNPMKISVDINALSTWVLNKHPHPYLFMSHLRNLTYCEQCFYKCPLLTINTLIKDPLLLNISTNNDKESIQICIVVITAFIDQIMYWFGDLAFIILFFAELF